MILFLEYPQHWRRHIEGLQKTRQQEIYWITQKYHKSRKDRTITIFIRFLNVHIFFSRAHAQGCLNSQVSLYKKKNTPKIQGLLQVNYHDRLRFAESILGKKFNFDNYMYIEHLHMYTQFHSVSEILVKKRHIYLKSAWIHSKAKH